MNRMCLGIMAGLLLGGGVLAPKPPLLPEKDVRVLANELSGEMAKRNLEVIATAHRQRGSQGFHAAAEFVTERLRAYGLSDLEIFKFPADGRIFCPWVRRTVALQGILEIRISKYFVKMVLSPSSAGVLSLAVFRDENQNEHRIDEALAT